MAGVPNAGAIFGQPPWMAGVPKMQEQFSANGSSTMQVAARIMRPNDRAKEGKRESSIVAQ
jgi:hypothetical protein